MQHNFDKILNRDNTGSIKYDGRKQVFGQKNLIPLWVADMDFEVPPSVSRALTERINHPVFGYTLIGHSFYDSIRNWLMKQYDWDVPSEWILFCPGIVPALTVSVIGLTNDGDKVLLQSPVYPPFFTSITDNKRVIVNNQLIEKNGRYEIDFVDLEEKLASGVKLMLFCSPHNPVGRVWKKQEVRRVVTLCKKYDITLVSDEIHSDIIYKGNYHEPAQLAYEDKSKIITCMAPSKTFNLAGLASSFLIIPDEKIRFSIQRVLANLHINHGNIFGVEALQAAYNGGGDWLVDLLNYLSVNRDMVVDFFQKELPVIKPVSLEGTYLVWLDCRLTGLREKDLRNLFIKKAGVGMNPGRSFGPGGDGFFRMNIACPRSVLNEALQKIKKAWIDEGLPNIS